MCICVKLFNYIVYYIQYLTLWVKNQVFREVFVKFRLFSILFVYVFYTKGIILAIFISVGYVH